MPRGNLHESIQEVMRRIANDLEDQVNKVVNNEDSDCPIWLPFIGSYGGNLINELGCHERFRKEADGGIELGEEITQDQLFPPIISEFAVRDESLKTLLAEVASWLSKYADVQFVLAIKFWIPNDKSKRGFDMEFFCWKEPYYSPDICPMEKLKIGKTKVG